MMRIAGVILMIMGMGTRMKRTKTSRTSVVRSTEAELTMSRHLCLLFATSFKIVHIFTVLPAFRDELTRWLLVGMCAFGCFLRVLRPRSVLFRVLLPPLSHIAVSTRHEPE